MTKKISNKGFVEITPAEGMWLFNGKECLKLICTAENNVADLRSALQEVDNTFKEQWEAEHQPEELEA